MLCGYEPPNDTVLGRFPTLFNTRFARNPNYRGANHFDWKQEWLGNVYDPRTPVPKPWVSYEEDAWDINNDEDGEPNIKVVVACEPDHDHLDDGIDPTKLMLKACQEAILRIKVGSSPAAPEGTRYLNVLFDWDRNGTWAGHQTCYQTADAPEWAVRNLAFDLNSNQTRMVITDPFTVGKVLGKVWMRITLTRDPIDETVFKPAPVGLGWDGSARPGGFVYGETEDYLVPVYPDNSPPVVMILGYALTYLTEAEGGHVQHIAMVSDPDGYNDILKVEWYFLGNPTGVLLYDDGTHEDFGKRDGIFGIGFDVQPGIPPTWLLLEPVAVDDAGALSIIGAKLTVEP